MNTDYILLTGIEDPQRLEAYFASHFVDVACAELLSSHSVKVLVEPETDLRKEEDVYWLLNLVLDALRENHEDDFTTEIVLTSDQAKERA